MKIRSIFLFGMHYTFEVYDDTIHRSNREDERQNQARARVSYRTVWSYLLLERRGSVRAGTGVWVRVSFGSCSDERRVRDGVVGRGCDRAAAGRRSRRSRRGRDTSRGRRIVCCSIIDGPYKILRNPLSTLPVCCAPRQQVQQVKLQIVSARYSDGSLDEHEFRQPERPSAELSWCNSCSRPCAASGCKKKLPWPNYFTRRGVLLEEKGFRKGVKTWIISQIEVGVGAGALLSVSVQQYSSSIAL